ncbi:MurR/RpiR family transcriptional regulator [Treponema sp.]
MTNIEIRIRNIFDKLSPAEKNIATFLLDKRDSIFSMPIAQLALESGVSQVAWVRFCKTLGFMGLKDLKRQLFTQINEAATVPASASYSRSFTDIKDYGSLSEIALTIKESSIRAIEETIKILDMEALERAVQLLIKAESVKIFGVGASAIVAEDLFGKLLRIGKNSFFCRDIHMQLTYAASFSKYDVAVIISHSGRTQEMLEILDLAKNKGTPSLGISKYTKSPLVEKADLMLFTSAPEVLHRSGAMSSRIAQLVVIDTLFTAIASQDYERVERSLEESLAVLNTHKAKPLRNRGSDL